MKKLNVKWSPETFASVSLTIFADASTEICGAPINESNGRFQTGAPGKLIIISDGGELCANVATLQ
jgi:hypothetical protein